jgi:hypothetical protein
LDSKINLSNFTTRSESNMISSKNHINSPRIISLIPFLSHPKSIGHPSNVLTAFCRHYEHLAGVAMNTLLKILWTHCTSHSKHRAEVAMNILQKVIWTPSWFLNVFCTPCKRLSEPLTECAMNTQLMVLWSSYERN